MAKVIIIIRHLRKLFSTRRMMVVLMGHGSSIFEISPLELRIKVCGITVPERETEDLYTPLAVALGKLDG